MRFPRIIFRAIRYSDKILAENREMRRRQKILRNIGTGTRGIEIAPWFNPIVPPGGKREVHVLDVLDCSALRARAEADTLIDKAKIRQIGPVDLVGSACEIAELARARFGPDSRFDFVVSSHNLEHLPDPVRFLRGCQTLLRTGGIVAMVVPDKRACFDFFRSLSTTGDLLQAFHEHREKPSPAQIFDQAAYFAGLQEREGDAFAFSIDDDPHRIALLGDVAGAYSQWVERMKADDANYHDTHCWTFTPSSLELILTELNLLRLVNFDIVSVTRSGDCEFIVQLRKRPDDARLQSELSDRRESLLQRTIDELAYTSCYAKRLRNRTSGLRTAILGDTRAARNGIRRLLRRIHREIRGCYRI